MKKLTLQEVIDLAVELYDDKGFSRSDIWIFLRALQALGSDFDLDRVFDLVVG